MILNEARIISNSDGGTVYLLSEDDKKLNFEIMQTESLELSLEVLQYQFLNLFIQ